MEKNLIFKKYKDLHKGKRVFLIGNGPSLASTDLNLLRNEITIGMNRISLIYDKFKNWRPTYYLFSSTNVEGKNWSKEWKDSVIKSIQEPKTTSFISSQFKNSIDPNNLHNQINWFHSMTEIKPKLDGSIHKSSFSKNIIERIDKTGTSMNIALQLTYHMGFDEIIFLGTDLGWQKDHGTKTDPNHFIKDYRAEILNPLKTNFQMRNVHILAKKIFNENKPEVKIFNASSKTVLDTYPIIDYEEYILSQKIIYKKEQMDFALNFWKNKKIKLFLFNLNNFTNKFIERIKKYFYRKYNTLLLKVQKNKKDVQKIDTEENGFVYICTGESYAKECLFSIESLKKNTKKKICVFSEEKYKEFFNKKVDYFISIDTKIKRPKVDYINSSPFIKSVYLDTDTFINYNVDDLFVLLDKFEIAGTICHSRSRVKYSKKIPEYSKIPYSFSEMNSGILAFKKNDNTKKLFKIWKDYYYKYLEETHGYDQPSFRIALWEANLKQINLPVEYNVRPLNILEKIKNMSADELGEEHMIPRIIHAHYASEVHKGIYKIDNLEELEKILKKNMIPITY